jgi:hypothetical protein
MPSQLKAASAALHLNALWLLQLLLLVAAAAACIGTRPTARSSLQ